MWGFGLGFFTAWVCCSIKGDRDGYYRKCRGYEYRHEHRHDHRHHHHRHEHRHDDRHDRGGHGRRCECCGR